MLDPSSQFCHNSDCPARGKVGEGNITIHSQKEHRYRCTVCAQTFASTKGTPFYRLHKATDLMVIVLTLLCHGCPIQAIVATFGLDERTVADWQARGGQQQVHEHIVQQGQVDLQHVQADELWVKMVGKRVWMAMAMAVPSRLWLGGVISVHRDRELITNLVKMVRSCASSLGILVCVDGLSSYVTAFLRVFRNPVPTGRRGRPRLVLPEGLPVVKPGVTSVSGVVDTTGKFKEAVTAKSEDAKVTLSVGKDTVGKTKEGKPLSEISILKMVTPPALPSDTKVIGLVYDLGPEGATFNPAISLTFTYDSTLIPAGVNEKNLVIAIWDAVTGNWVVLTGCKVDPVTHTITVPVSHFTAFTILAYTRPATFTTSALTVTPAEVNVGETVTISTLVTNTGDLSGSYIVVLKVSNVIETSESVFLAGGASQTVTFTISRDIAGTYTVTVDGLAGAFTVKKALVPAGFSTSALTVTPAEVNVGETVTISVLVANAGDLSGSYEVTLKINNVTEATNDVTLAGGASQTVAFTTSRSVAGTYTVTVDGLAGIFTVKTPITPPIIPPKPVDWALIGSIIAGAIIIIGLIVWLLVRRRTAQGA